MAKEEGGRAVEASPLVRDNLTQLADELEVR
jgi:hypothetical protein